MPRSPPSATTQFSIDGNAKIDAFPHPALDEFEFLGPFHREIPHCLFRLCSASDCCSKFCLCFCICPHQIPPTPPGEKKILSVHCFLSQGMELQQSPSVYVAWKTEPKPIKSLVKTQRVRASEIQKKERKKEVHALSSLRCKATPNKHRLQPNPFHVLQLSCLKMILACDKLSSTKHKMSSETELL